MRLFDMPRNIERVKVAACVCSGLGDGSLRARAQAVGSELIDELNGIDYQNYFDAMGTPGKRGGQQEAQFAAFSLSAAHAAQVCYSSAHVAW